MGDPKGEERKNGRLRPQTTQTETTGRVKTVKKLMKTVWLLTAAALALCACSALAQGRVRINPSSNAKVRDSASFNGKNVAQAAAGAEYELLEDAGEWYRIRLDDGTEGWVYNSTATIVEAGEGETAEGAEEGAPEEAEPVEGEEAEGADEGDEASLPGEAVRGPAEGEEIVFAIPDLSAESLAGCVLFSHEGVTFVCEGYEDNGAFLLPYGTLRNDTDADLTVTLEYSFINSGIAPVEIVPMNGGYGDMVCPAHGECGAALVLYLQAGTAADVVDFGGTLRYTDANTQQELLCRAVRFVPGAEQGSDA